MKFLILLSVFFVFYGFLLAFISKLFSHQNHFLLEKPKKNPSVAIMIPARDESKVIEGLLQSIERQTLPIPSQNVYVIVEDLHDPTVKITKLHHMNVFVRQKKELQTKGYALAELVEDLCQKKKEYDCYFIFDADNILDERFLEEMMKDYHKGYAVSTGYRALKNTDSYFSVSAGLTFFLVNEIRNRMSLKNDGNIILSGTGYYIYGKYLKQWQTFPFYTLTEDYESSLYYTLHGISTHYNEKAIFYDEQPTNYRMSIKQRSRWIKGYFQNWFSYQSLFRKRKKEKPQNLGSIVEMQIGILPVIFIVFGLFLLLCLLLGLNLFHHQFQFFLLFFFFLFLVYAFLVFLTALLLWMAKKKMKISKKVCWQVLFYHPIFLFSYLHAFFVSLFKKDLRWEKIERMDQN